MVGPLDLRRRRLVPPSHVAGSPESVRCPGGPPGAGNHDVRRPGGAPAPMHSVGCRRGPDLVGWGGRLRRARLIRQRAMRQGPGGRFLDPTDRDAKPQVPEATQTQLGSSAQLVI